eukprot:5868727-Pleurochrysis_carterae.AAC.1
MSTWRTPVLEAALLGSAPFSEGSGIGRFCGRPVAPARLETARPSIAISLGVESQTTRLLDLTNSMAIKDHEHKKQVCVQSIESLYVCRNN